MSNATQLKTYLIDKGYLLDSWNEGKTIMLSGVWGAGKTYFWKNHIEPEIKEKLNKEEKACVYVSLYGKESISEIKYEIFKEAYNSIVSEDIISKSAALFASIAPALAEKSLTGKESLKGLVNIFENGNKNAKDKKSIEILKNGSIICLDDFERKSKNVDLNDLFGFITHLSEEYNCKVVIILNSDVFEGREAKVFKQVKEKTVNKYLYLNPTIKELFETIFHTKDSDGKDKYELLRPVEKHILEVILETGELNARIYTQILDNCYEWYKEYKSENLRALILLTICFVKHHFILKTRKHPGLTFNLTYTISEQYPEPFKDYISAIKTYESEEAFISNFNITEEEFINNLKKRIVIQTNSKYVYTVNRHNEYGEWMDQNIEELKALYKYGYKLYIAKNTNSYDFLNMANFVESGVLPEV